MLSAASVPGRLLAPDSVDEAVDHLDDQDVIDQAFIDEAIARCRQSYQNFLQLRVGSSLEVCADQVAAKSCVFFQLFGYSFVIHKIPCLKGKQ